MKINNVIDSLTVHETKKYKKRSENAITSIAIHHSGTIDGGPHAFARYHVKLKGWPGIGYAYVIAKDGEVFKTNEHTSVTYHVGNSNYNAIGICLVGDFTVEEPQQVQLKAAANLVHDLMYKLKNLREIKAHQDYPGYSWKACPAFDVMRITNLIEGVEL